MPNSVGKNIKRLREAKGISQNGLAKMSNVSQSAISSIEATTKSPSVDTVFLLAKALGVSVTSILFSPEELEKLTAMGDELDNELLDVIRQLSPQDQQRLKDFAEGLIAARKE
jgi:transcriptional regulator with XRE-family HTH domain